MLWNWQASRPEPGACFGLDSSGLRPPTELSGTIWKLLTSVCPTLVLFQVLVKESQLAGPHPKQYAFRSHCLYAVSKQDFRKKNYLEKRYLINCLFSSVCSVAANSVYSQEQHLGLAAPDTLSMWLQTSKTDCICNQRDTKGVHEKKIILWLGLL